MEDLAGSMCYEQAKELVSMSLQLTQEEEAKVNRRLGRR